MRDLLERLEVSRAKEKDKWACPWCGSRDALHDYGERVKCFSCGISEDTIGLVRHVQGLGYKEALEYLGLPLPPRHLLPTSRWAVPKPGAKMRLSPERVRNLFRELPDGPPPPEIVAYLQAHGLTWAALKTVAEVRAVTDLRAYHAALKAAFEGPELEAFTTTRQDGQRRSLPSKTPFLALAYLGHDLQMEYVRFRCFAGPKYLGPSGYDPPSPYGVHLLGLRRAGAHVYITEGELDAIVLHTHGLAAIGVPGATHWLPQWARWVSGVYRVVILGDGDEAGRKFSKGVKKSLLETVLNNRDVEIRDLPEGLDIGDLAAQGRLAEVIRE